MKLVRELIFTFMGVGILLSVILLILFRLNLPVFLFILAVVFLCVGAGFLISGYFSGRLDSLYDGVRVVKSGNLDYKVNTYSEDGIGQISKEFDEVVEELKKVKEELALSQMETTGQREEINELKKKEEHFRRLFEQSNDAVFVYDLDGRIINVNNKACDMLGYPREVMSDVNFFGLQKESELTMSKYAFKTANEACAIRYESRMERANGEAIDVEISTSAVDMKKGIMQSIVSNITARKNMQKALEESEEQFRTFMETASDLMFIVDGEGNITYANRAMANTLGYMREEVEELKMTDILTQESLDAYVEAERILKEKGEVRYEPVWETKNRKKIYGEMTASAVFDENGDLAGVRGIFRDITEREKVVESQRLANLGKLAADVAHEVNNPITIILARAEMLKAKRKDDEDIQEKMQIIISQCEDAISIVKRLLKFSKPSKKQFTRININDRIKTVIDLIGHQFLSCQVSINTYFAGNLPEVEADEKQIQEVFMNLLRNAKEAIGADGKVEIYTYEKKGRVYADIKDSGEGISSETMNKIFDPFFTTKENGTGLGVSVCYGIMRAHNGDLQYFSKKDEGTTARVILPAAE